MFGSRCACDEYGRGCDSLFGDGVRVPKEQYICDRDAAVCGGHERNVMRNLCLAKQLDLSLFINLVAALT